MKKKTKLALLGALVSCGVLASATTATAAWFTVNSNVSVSHTNLILNADNAYLRATLFDIAGKASSYESSQQISGAAQNITDGIHFSAASGYDGFNYVKKVGGSTNVIQAADLYKSVYVFGVQVDTFALQATHILKVNVGWNARIPSNPDNRDLASWVRVAMVPCSLSTFTTQKPGQKTTLFVSDATETPQYLNSSGSLADVPSTVDVAQQATFVDAGEYIDNTSYYFRFAVWMEGTLDDAQDLARGTAITLTTTFSSVVKPAA